MTQNFKIAAGVIAAVGALFIYSDVQHKKQERKWSASYQQAQKRDMDTLDALITKLRNDIPIKELAVENIVKKIKEVPDKEVYNEDDLLMPMLSAIIEKKADSAKIAKQKQENKYNNQVTKINTIFINLGDEKEDETDLLKIVFDYQADQVRQRLQTGTWSSGNPGNTRDMVMRLRSIDSLRYIAVSDVTHMLHPKLRGSESFESGAKIGTVKIFEVATGKLVREAKVYALNSKQVSTYSMRGNESSTFRMQLEGDLRMRYSTALTRAVFGTYDTRDIYDND